MTERAVSMEESLSRALEPDKPGQFQLHDELRWHEVNDMSMCLSGVIVFHI